MQVLRKNFRDLVFVCTFGEDDTSEKKVVYSDTDEDRILLMVREFTCFIWNGA
jgi:poly(A)-specific ribonuclease